MSFDLQGDVYSGTVWIAAYVRADFDEVGQDFWRNANAEKLGYETRGSEEYFWNWGADYGPPCWPIPGSSVYGQTADMSWKIEGTPVPEPSLLSPAVAAALYAGYLRLRQT